VKVHDYDTNSNPPAGAIKMIEFDVEVVECMVVIEYDAAGANLYP
jgi:hypothetical protein